MSVRKIHAVTSVLFVALILTASPHLLAYSHPDLLQTEQVLVPAQDPWFSMPRPVDGTVATLCNVLKDFIWVINRLHVELVLSVTLPLARNLIVERYQHRCVHTSIFINAP